METAYVNNLSVQFDEFVTDTDIEIPLVDCQSELYMLRNRISYTISMQQESMSTVNKYIEKVCRETPKKIAFMERYIRMSGGKSEVPVYKRITRQAYGYIASLYIIERADNKIDERLLESLSASMKITAEQSKVLIADLESEFRKLGGKVTDEMIKRMLCLT